MFWMSEDDCARDILISYGLPLHDDSCWWVKYPKRAAEEVYKMYENTNAAITGTDGRELVFEEVITNNFGTQFHTQLRTGSRFPFKLPKSYVLEPRIVPSADIHMYSEGHLCLMHPSQYSSNMSILDIRNQTAAWCECYEIFRETGVWHAAEYKH